MRTQNERRAAASGALVPTQQIADVVFSDRQPRIAHPQGDLLVDLQHRARGERPGQPPRLLAERAEHVAAPHDRRRITASCHMASKVMSCAPSQRTIFPSWGSCSAPSSMVATWLPASWPILLPKTAAP